eukprot:gene15648-15795_t
MIEMDSNPFVPNSEFGVVESEEAVKQNVTLPSTEETDQRFVGIDCWSSSTILDVMWEAQLAAVAVIRPALASIAAAAEAAVPRLLEGGRLVYAGAGTSGRIGVQDGAELPPTFNWKADRLVLLMAGGDRAFTQAVENAEDDLAAGEAAIGANQVGPKDVVIGIAASGSTPFTLGCLQAAGRAGALTVAVSNSAAGSILKAASHPILVETGAEVIAGSTRMKAGTAQKVVLNLLSSLIMVRMGRVHDGLMVDMVATNEKLRRRAERMVQTITGATLERARDALTAGGGRVKTAVVSARDAEWIAVVKAILASQVFDGMRMLGPAAVLVEDGRVADVVGQDAFGSGVPVERLAEDCVLAPGFVDLQVNGGGGVMFNDTPDVATLRVIADAHARMGTTSILPTLISSDRVTRRAAIAAVRKARAAGVAGIAGIHLEGPFLAPSRRGIHPASAITVPDADDIRDLSAAFDGVMLITLAPEVVPAGDVAALVRAGRVVFAGHSDASFEQAGLGFDAGVRGTTHLFNAMSQLGSRAPGLVGAAMARGFAGIIVDLLHVHAASVAVAYRAMGAGRLFLVSDAMATAGSDCTGFQVGGNAITLVDGRLQDASGTLAGAHLSMAEAVRRSVEGVGIPLEDALRMATGTAAAAAGLADRGRISAGALADFVALDAGVGVVRVWRGRFFLIAEALCRSVGNAIRPGFIDAVLAMIVVRRIQRIRGILLALEARFLAGVVLRRPVRVRAADEAVAVAAAASLEPAVRAGGDRLPRRSGWLFNLVPHEAACWAGHMRLILAEPGMQALLKGCPQAVRVLRPLCVMLGIARGDYVPAGAVADVRRKRVRVAKVKPDRWVFDQAREDAHYALTQVPRKWRLRVRAGGALWGTLWIAALRSR